MLRELLWGLPRVAAEVRRWQLLASKIPCPGLREDAERALETKRGQSDGAALFAILPRRRNAHLIRFLAAYQTIWDYLDSVHERAPTRENGEQLHEALVDAIDTHKPLGDYYRLNPEHDDAGYLSTLVALCRDSCAQIPGYGRVRTHLIREATRARTALAINHNPDPRERDSALRRWVAAEFPDATEARWFEISGAASAGLAMFALLALACEPGFSEDEIGRTVTAYTPWASAVACMLDAYSDQVADAESGDHSYVAHYNGHGDAAQAIRRLVSRYTAEVGQLRRKERHLVIASSMIALYLSKDVARNSRLRTVTTEIAASGGAMTRALVPVLRIWRSSHINTIT